MKKSDKKCFEKKKTILKLFQKSFQGDDIILYLLLSMLLIHPHCMLIEKKGENLAHMLTARGPSPRA